MTVEPMKIVLIDARRMFVEALTLGLEADPEIKVVGTAGDSDEGLRRVLETRPDLVLLDVDLPGAGAFELAATVIARQHETRVAFLTDYLCDVFVAQVLHLRAHGYLLKSESIGALNHHLRRVRSGGVCFSPEVVERLTWDDASGRYAVRRESRLDALTGRQLEVLRHLARGATLQEIAAAMRISTKTVESHKRRVLHALGMRDRIELTRFAIREGLLLP